MAGPAVRVHMAGAGIPVCSRAFFILAAKVLNVVALVAAVMPVLVRVELRAMSVGNSTVVMGVGLLCFRFVGGMAIMMLVVVWVTMPMLTLMLMPMQRLMLCVPVAPQLRRQGRSKAL